MRGNSHEELILPNSRLTIEVFLRKLKVQCTDPSALRLSHTSVSWRRNRHLQGKMVASAHTTALNVDSRKEGSTEERPTNGASQTSTPGLGSVQNDSVMPVDTHVYGEKPIDCADGTSRMQCEQF